jgi:hypothetical protein
MIPLWGSLSQWPWTARRYTMGGPPTPPDHHNTQPPPPKVPRAEPSPRPPSPAADEKLFELLPSSERPQVAFVPRSNIPRLARQLALHRLVGQYLALLLEHRRVAPHQAPQVGGAVSAAWLGAVGGPLGSARTGRAAADPAGRCRSRVQRAAPASALCSKHHDCRSRALCAGRWCWEGGRAGLDAARALPIEALPGPCRAAPGRRGGGLRGAAAASLAPQALSGQPGLRRAASTAASKHEHQVYMRVTSKHVGGASAAGGSAACTRARAGGRPQGPLARRWR